MSSEEEQYEKAVGLMNSGDDSAKTTVAYYLLTGKRGADYDAEKAVAMLQERALKDKKAVWMLGLCHEFGIGIEKDIVLAKELYGRSWGSEVGKLLGLRDTMGGDFDDLMRSLFQGLFRVLLRGMTVFSDRN